MNWGVVLAGFGVASLVDLIFREEHYPFWRRTAIKAMLLVTYVGIIWAIRR
jgi:hypothetical protein